MAETIYHLKCLCGFEKKAPTQSHDDVLDIVDHIIYCDRAYSLEKKEI